MPCIYALLACLPLCCCCPLLDRRLAPPKKNAPHIRSLPTCFGHFVFVCPGLYVKPATAAVVVLVCVSCPLAAALMPHSWLRPIFLLLFLLASA